MWQNPCFNTISGAAVYSAVSLIAQCVASKVPGVQAVVSGVSAAQTPWEAPEPLPEAPPWYLPG